MRAQPRMHMCVRGCLRFPLPGLEKLVKHIPLPALFLVLALRTGRGMPTGRRPKSVWALRVSAASWLQVISRQVTMVQCSVHP